MRSTAGSLGDTQIGLPAPTHGPNGGVVDEARAAFVAHGRKGEHGLPFYNHHDL
jgi:hypothetical protein